MRTSPLMTTKKALEIQTEQLAIWKKVLNRKTYSLLIKEVKSRNKHYLKYEENMTPYDVFRGQSIDSWIINYAIKLP